MWVLFLFVTCHVTERENISHLIFVKYWLNHLKIIAYNIRLQYEGFFFVYAQFQTAH